MPQIVKARRLEGQVAIVTAATLGIGYAIAERLGLEGAAVVICSRKKENVEEAVASLKKAGVQKVAGIECQISNPEHQKRLVDFTIEKFGKINILINNHGINPAFGDMMDLEDRTWDKLFETNVKSGWQLTKLVVPHMQKEGGGNIVFNASIGGYITSPMIATYAVTKTALLGLTKALSRELSRQKIRVNGIAPGVIKTKMSKALWESGEEGLAAAQEISMGRLGVPEDCAGAVAFLVSDDASYITGETIVIAGGVHARL
ncbi:unnamed protein product, partial [Mesorhabditis belari]|uniref:Dehydrogenase/reductase SDR family member 4 n=1 Tax=Mesorhabditis belari TaxID=2138241 RepID=A0AAF3FFJ7_9BILA